MSKSDDTVTLESFDSLTSCWLQSGSPLMWDCIFVLPPWLEVWWHDFGSEAELYLGAFRRGGAIAGIAPLLLRGAEACPIWTRGFAGDCVCISGGSGRADQIVSRNCADLVLQSSTLRSPPVHQPDSGVCPAILRSNRHCAITISTQSVFREWPYLVMLNSIEPPWYATRMPGGVTGKAREGLPMSIFKQ